MRKIINFCNAYGILMFISAFVVFFLGFFMCWVLVEDGRIHPNIPSGLSATTEISSSSVVEISSSSVEKEIEIPARCSADTAAIVWLKSMNTPAMKECTVNTVTSKFFKATDLMVYCKNPRIVPNNLKNFNRTSMKIVDNHLYAIYSCDWEN